MKLSIGMMVKNESKYLDECLKHLQRLRDSVDSELVIVDTGSTDNTVDIAKKYTDKIYFHQWNDNFSEIRNLTIKYSTGEWFFCIDADEILENPDEIIDFLNSDKSLKYNSVSIIVKNITESTDDSKYSVFSSLRLFRKDKDFRYEGSVHNQPKAKAPTMNLKTAIKHYGYLTDDKELMERKFKRTSSILKRELEKNPDSIYYWYQLSVSYGMHSDFSKAIEPIEKAYNLLGENRIDKIQHLYVYSQMALMYLDNSMYEKTISVCNEAIDLKDDFLDLYYYIAAAEGNLNKYEDSIRHYERYLELLKNYYNINENNFIISYTVNRKEEVYKNLIILYNKLNENNKIYKYISFLSDKKMIDLILMEIETIFVNNNKFDDLFEYYKNKIEDDEQKNLFFSNLNKIIDVLKKDKKILLLDYLKSRNDDFGILCGVKLNLINEHYNDFKLLDIINHDFFINKPAYYGEILYYIMKSKQNVFDYLYDLKDNTIVEFLQYLINKYKDVDETLYDAVFSSNESDIEDIRIIRIFERIILINNKIEKDKYNIVFEKYIKTGQDYILYVYNKDIIENEYIDFVKNEEDEFYIYIYKAGLNKTDGKLYIEYLLKALKAYPLMKDGIEYLKDKFNNKFNEKNIEFENDRNKIKKTIGDLIENNKLEDAERLIKEYEKIVKEDAEILFYKSEIALKGNSKVSNIN